MTSSGTTDNATKPPSSDTDTDPLGNPSLREAWLRYINMKIREDVLKDGAEVVQSLFVEVVYICRARETIRRISREES